MLNNYYSRQFECSIVTKIITISRIINTSLINYVEFLQGLQRHNSNADFFLQFYEIILCHPGAQRGFRASPENRFGSLKTSFVLENQWRIKI